MQQSHRSERRNLDSEIRERLSYVGRRQVLHRRGVKSNESLRRVKDKKSETLNSVLLLYEVKTRVRRPVPINCERGARKTFSSRIACDLTKNKESILKKQHSMQLHSFLKEDSPE